LGYSAAAKLPKEAAPKKYETMDKIRKKIDSNSLPGRSLLSPMNLSDLMSPLAKYDEKAVNNIRIANRS